MAENAYGYIGYFNGIKLIADDCLVKKIQKKTHKWKWLNWIYKIIYGYMNVPDGDLYFMSDRIIGHPEVLKKLIDKIK